MPLIRAMSRRRKPSNACVLGLAVLAGMCMFLLVSGTARAADPVIAAAGDIACDPSDANYKAGLGTSTACRQRYTANLLVNAGLARVLPLGDNQYNSGSLSNYGASYDPTWGRVKSLTSPVVGNHEPGNATGYYDYFNGSGNLTGPAGERGKGYYSYDIGAWHLIALNSNCSRIPCSAGSAQERWLRADLAANSSKCTLAYFHHARFSSGHDGNNTFMQAVWQDLYNAQADVVLSGHSHDYERFAPQNAAGKLDWGNGIRQFVVGTGGAFFTGLSSAKPNSEVRQNNTYGVLFLTLSPASYSWRFVPEAGRSFSDSGTTACHGPGDMTVPPFIPGPPPPAPGVSPTIVNPVTGVVSSGAGVRCTVTGTDNADVLTGTPANDVICGLGGADAIRGGEGNDVIYGGNGKDRIRGGRGNDWVYGHGRADMLSGGSGNDHLDGGGSKDRLYGNAGNDVLLTSADRRGGDRLSGGAGRDSASLNSGDHRRSIERLLRR